MSKAIDQPALVEKDKGTYERLWRPRGARVTYAGLCSSCVHAPYCTFLRFADQPVIHCEEWSGDTAAWETLETPEMYTPPPWIGAPLPSPQALPKGLCATCEEYSACAFAKPEGGVWHCEEYR